MTKEEIKTLLSSFKQEDFYKGIDLHIHSTASDGKMTPYEIVEQAKERGMRYIAIADHNSIDAYLSTNILKDDFVIPAVEFDCIYKGVLVHILGYGINIDNRGIRNICAKSKYGTNHNICRLFELRNPKDVIDTIQMAGGIAVLAHPCCYWTPNLDKFIKEFTDMGIDGVEVYYRYHGLRKFVKFHSECIVSGIAEKYNLIKTGGTDSHGKSLMTLS